MVSHSEDERVADIADQSLRGNVDHGNNGFDEIPGSRLGKAGFVAVTGSPLISFGNDAGLFEPHLHDVPHFPFSTFRPPLGSLQDAPLEGMSDPTDPDVHPIKAGAPPSAHCALQSYTDETYNVACPASFLDSSIRGMAQFHDPDALNAYFFQSMQGFGALSDVLDKGPFSVANDHGAYRPPESHDDGKTPASDTTPQQHRVTGYPAVLSDAGLTSGPPASHREGPSRPPPICVTPHKRSAEVAPDATGASPPVDRRPHRADDQAAAPPSTVRRPKLGSSAFGATEDETWRADESEDDDLVEAADGVVTARVFSAPGDRERSEEMGRRARRGAAGRWGGRAGRVSETELLEEMRASSARRRKERVVCDGPTEEDLERQREKRGKRAKIGQEDCAALRELCEGLQVDERSITDWAAAVMPSDEATVLHKGLGCPVPGRRKTVGLVYRKRQRVWCVQLWFRSRTHTLYWMPYSNFIVAGRARDRIVLHLRGLEECNARGFLNFPSEAPHHLNELAKLGRLFLSDVSPAGAPA